MIWKIITIIKKLKNKTKIMEKYQIKREIRYLFKQKQKLFSIFMENDLIITSKQLKNLKFRYDYINNLLKKNRLYNIMIPFVINKINKNSD